MEVMIKKVTRNNYEDQNKQEAYNAKNRESIILIKSSIIGDMLPQVQDATSGYEMWRILLNLHENSKMRPSTLIIYLTKLRKGNQFQNIC
jgi:isocitrate dehydrogenase